MKVRIVFDVDAGVTEDEAYDAAEAMVTAAPVEAKVLTFDGIEVER